MNLVIAVTAFGLLWLIHKKGWNRGRWMFIPLGFLALVGGAFLAPTIIGDKAVSVASWVAGLIGGAVGASGAVLLGAVVLIGTFWAGWALWKDRSADKPELAWLVVLPILFVAAAGPIASGGQDLTDAVRGAGQSSIGNLIGG